MTTRTMEYRLSWEMPLDLLKIDMIERSQSRDIWPTYDWDKLGTWVTSETRWKEGDRDDGMDQYETLKKWAETREQPIRNVKLEWRPVDEGNWEEVKPDG